MRFATFMAACAVCFSVPASAQEQGLDATVKTVYPPEGPFILSPEQKVIATEVYMLCIETYNLKTRLVEADPVEDFAQCSSELLAKEVDAGRLPRGITARLIINGVTRE